MVLEPDTGWCASEDAEPRRRVDTRRCASEDAGSCFAHRLERGTKASKDVGPK